MARLLALLLLFGAFAVAWVRLERIDLFVVGQPTSTGALQKTREAPFFEGLAQSSGLPLDVVYHPLDEVGFKDTHQLPMLRDGVFDLVSLRFIQNSDTEPSLQGLDFIGAYADYDTARKVVESYAGTVDGYLQRRFGAKLLGVWTFGPQVFFCKPPVRSLSDLAGLKVRVASENQAVVIRALGASPAIISFDDTRNALAIGLVDCAVTSAASANFAGWLDHVEHYFPLAMHFGLNGYAISLKTWQRLSARQQVALQAAFDAYIEELWRFSEDIHQDASRCIVGLGCRDARPYALAVTEPSEQDVRTLRRLALEELLPRWAERCEAIHPGCLREWREKVLAVVQP